MAKYEVSEALKESIEADIEQGVKWKLIAQEHGIDYAIVSSVGHKRRKRLESEELVKSGIIRYWGSLRLTDGKPSPITTYHITKLQKEGK